MIAWRPPEVLFNLGSLSIHTYGVLLATAIVLGFWWVEVRTRRTNIGVKLVGDIFFISVVAAIVGARLGFVVQNLSYYLDNPIQILAFRQGGLTFYGGLAAGIIVMAILLLRRKKIHLFSTLAGIAAAPLFLGDIFVRLGNWSNQELYGYPSTLPWTIQIDSVNRLPGFENFSTFHPTFAYESILNLIGLFVLLFIVERIKAPAASSFYFFLIWYAASRFITEIWRISDRILGPLSLAQIISLGIILAMSSIVFLHKRNYSSA